MWLCLNKTLLTKIPVGPDLAQSSISAQPLIKKNDYLAEDKSYIKEEHTENFQVEFWGK